MYREYMYFFKAYFKTGRFKEFCFEIGIPLLITISVLFKLKEFKPEWISAIITVMAIILGFVIATISILITSDNQNLKEAANVKINKKFLEKDLTLLKQLIIIFFYMAFLSLLELIVGIVTLVFSLLSFKVIIFLNVFLTFHLIFLGIRNITNLFWIEFK